jgi:MazG family protein
MDGDVCRAVGRLRDIMAALRSPGGCPWDAVQTPETLKRYLLEETYEVLEALDGGRPSAIRDELGDLLLQIVFHARIFEERGEFDLSGVANAIADKLVRRHPHVFAGVEPGDNHGLAVQWERIKAEEQMERGEGKSQHGGPAALPALLRARKLSEKSRQAEVRPNTGEIFTECRAIFDRLEQEIDREDAAAWEQSLGEILYSLVRVGDSLNLDAEDALRKTILRRLRENRDSPTPPSKPR